jgi:hypothetical protein
MVFTVSSLVLAFACGSGITYLVGRDSADEVSQPPPATTSSTAAPQVRPSRSGELVIPELIGKNAAVAIDELKRMGFQRIELGSLDPEVESVAFPANWTVAKQSAGAGTPLQPDALIVLTCTRTA